MTYSSSHVEARTESILEIIQAVDDEVIMLPEFQRDFRWEMDQTYDLFDSLARDIFIGTIIYGKPSFDMSVRGLDMRPRRGDGSRQRISILNYSSEQLRVLTQTKHFRIVLDGQQRITSIVRALKGVDNIYLVLKSGVLGNSLEEAMDYFGGEDREERICVNIGDAFRSDRLRRDKEKLSSFYKMKYARSRQKSWDQDLNVRTQDENAYLSALGLLVDLFKDRKMVSYYLLDMEVDKFCAFFERSNSRGIQLDFADILAAKLYSGFNLRKKIEEFQDTYPDISFNRELITRSVAYLSSPTGKEQIDKTYILKSLRPEDFDRYWDETCKLYVNSINYLRSQHYIISQSWMASESMLLPLMMFIRALKGIENMDESQRRFVEYWFWASSLSSRYSGSTNERMIEDANILRRVANNDSNLDPLYLRRLRPAIHDASDLFSYSKKQSSVYKGLFCLINYAASGTFDWNSKTTLDAASKLEDHHIYPRKFIMTSPSYQDNQDALELVDSIPNRALISEIQNLKIGAKPPSRYMQDLQQRNKDLSKCLETHLIDPTIILDNASDSMFLDFVSDRAAKIFENVDRYSEFPPEIAKKYFRTTATRADTRIPVFSVYHGNRVEAYYLQERQRIEIEGFEMAVSTAAEEVVSRIGGPKRTRNGYQFWKYISEDGQELPIEQLRENEA